MTRRRPKGRRIDGWLIVDKGEGITSTQVVNRVKRLYLPERAGHAGTLDPIATGILPIAFGEATKTVPYVMDRQKSYRFRVRFGEARSTDDREGEVTATSDVRPTSEQIAAALPGFIGRIVQVPPKYSAIKIDGQRAYDLARAGEEPEMAPREVDVYSFTHVGTPDADHADFEVRSGKGCYMRALARDVALACGTVGHIAQLRRLSVGRFDEADAVPLEKLEEIGDTESLLQFVRPIERALDGIPALSLSSVEAGRVRNGHSFGLFSRADFARLEEAGLAELDDGTRFILTFEGRALAIAERQGAEIQPVRLLVR